VSALARLAELGIALPEVPPPAGAYVPAVRTGNLVYTSGQVARGLPAGSARRSRKPMPRTPPGCALNALAAVDALAGLDSVVRVVKVVGFVASAPGFTGQPG
jgi:Putative translation initiation inhibitor, yjgF family